LTDTPKAPTLILSHDRVALFHGDSALLDLPENSVDAIVCDPPAGIDFMSRGWDSDKGGRDLPAGFGPWLAGFCDGEANFDIHKQSRESGDYYYCRFELSLRADDGGTLAMCHKQLGGKLYYSDHVDSTRPNAKPQVRWELVSRAEVARLIDIFDRFPLQSKKARDFAIWREAFAVSAAHAGTSRPDLMEPFWHQLRGTRPYAGHVTDPSVFRAMQDEHRWIAWLAAVLAPAVRALRPGGAALLWALPRTSHWTARAVELAGLEIRDLHHDIISADEILQDFLATLDERQRVALARVQECAGAPIVYQIFGSGFPKSLDISKAVDQALGTTNSRKKIGEGKGRTGQAVNSHTDVHGDDAYEWPGTFAVTVAGSSEAARWTGYGTALKPAVEHWILARKPLEGTYADNILTHGTGALNIDACRIGTSKNVPASASKTPNAVYGAGMGSLTGGTENSGFDPNVGRWPAHLSLRHAPNCQPTGETATEQVPVFENAGEKDRDGNATDFAMGRQIAGAAAEVVRAIWRCAPGCPVAELDAQSGVRTSGARNTKRSQPRFNQPSKGDEHARDLPPLPGSSGGASRFFLTTPPFRYVAKPSRREKDAGLGHLKASTGGEATDREDGSAGLQSPRAGAGRTGGAKNSHETVKSISLMEWLIRLVVPDPATLGRPGVILDPFAGSGTTGVAALKLGHDWIGCEQGGEKDRYIPIVLGRIRHALGPLPGASDCRVDNDPDETE